MQLRLSALLLLLAQPVCATEPLTTASPSPAARPLVPDRFTPNEFADLTETRAARVTTTFPRITAFLESRRVEVEAAQALAARRSMPAARCPAIAALEAWLSQPPPPEALTQATTYLTADPRQLLRDAAMLLAALEELKLKEQVDAIRQETATEHAQLEQLAADPKLPQAEREQLRAQLADLARSEADMATTGQRVPPEALALAARHRPSIDQWSRWAWPKK